MPFVGAAAVLEPEHATIGAAPMSAAPKKNPLLQTIFHVVKYCNFIIFLVDQIELNVP